MDSAALSKGLLSTIVALKCKFQRTLIKSGLPVLKIWQMVSWYFIEYQYDFVSQIRQEIKAADNQSDSRILRLTELQGAWIGSELNQYLMLVNCR